LFQCPGFVTTVAGSGSGAFGDGIGTFSSFNAPQGMSISPDGTFALIADTGNNRIRRFIMSTGEVSTAAGSGLAGFQDAIGTEAALNSPRDVAISPDGRFALIADYYNNRIRYFNLESSEVSTVSGNGSYSFSDGVGTFATFRNPRSISISPSGSYALIIDFKNYMIRRLDLSTKVLSTLVGTGNFSQLPSGQSVFLYGISISPDSSFAIVSGRGNSRVLLIRIDLNSNSSYVNFSDVYTVMVFMSVRFSRDSKFLWLTSANVFGKLDFTNGTVSIVAGSTNFNIQNSYMDGIGSMASFSSPNGLALSADNTFALVSDYSNHLVREVYLSRPCTAGYFCPNSSSSPLVCPVGSFCPAASASPVQCSNTSGYFCRTSGLSAPKLCQAGFACSLNSFNLFGAVDLQGLFSEFFKIVTLVTITCCNYQL
jgi:DNA-binding beta-propeller fold protein YncE